VSFWRGSRQSGLSAAVTPETAKPGDSRATDEPAWIKELRAGDAPGVLFRFGCNRRPQW